MMKTFACVCAFAGLAVLGACEKAGESIDSAIETAVDGKKDMKDGAFEKAGEAVDKTLGAERKNDADSLADAVDGDKSTKAN
jgi:vacuolar-type H+-ATPase subunit H